MTIALTGSGGLFTRIGHIGGGLLDVAALMGGTATARVLSGASMVTRVGQLYTDYTASVAFPTLLEGLPTAVAKPTGDGGWQTAQANIFSYFTSLATKTIIEMADSDAVLQARTLEYALAELIRQMTANTEYVESSVVAAGSQTDVGTPIGDNEVVASVKNVYGKSLQYLVAETINIVCTQDSQVGATAWREAFSVKGETAVPATAYNWPQGSGGAGSVQSVDSLQDVNTSGNVLQNSDFDTATTTNHPDNWVKVTGTIGTSITLDTSTIFGPGTKALEILGDGSELTCLRQPFNMTASTTADAGGSPYTLKPNTVYHYCFWYKNSSASPSTGVLRVALVDGSNAVIADDASTNNSVSTTLTSVADTDWHAVKGSFITPKNMSVSTAGNYKLEIKLTTALQTGRSVFIDRLTLTPATQLYRGGPYFSVHSGETKPVLNDRYTVAITNTWGVFQQLFQRLFDMRALGLQLPNDPTQTVNDSLVA